MSSLLDTVDPDDTLLIESDKQRAKELAQIEREATVVLIKELLKKWEHLGYDIEGEDYWFYETVIEDLYELLELNKDKVDE